MEPLFSYGTLQRAQVQRAVFGRTVAMTPDTLAGYRVGSLRYGQGDGAPTYKVLEPDASAPLVPGVLLDLSPAELAAADAYEGHGYRRTTATFGSGRTGWVYIRA